jgi:hypothetical protein
MADVEDQPDLSIVEEVARENDEGGVGLRGWR